ncbi:MAG: DUF983 domain-containing protein [Rhodospirillales bacterium]|nr:DUF983 domain-containing protein [Rhodospirillales bacterium]
MQDRQNSRPVGRSVFRGLCKRCPQCGQGRIFRRYLKPVHACSQCGEAYGHIRTDDFAPWLTILFLGHILAPVIIQVERWYSPPVWGQLMIVVPLTFALVLALLPTAKGTCLGFMWALGFRAVSSQIKTIPMAVRRGNPIGRPRGAMWAHRSSGITTRLPAGSHPFGTGGFARLTASRSLSVVPPRTVDLSLHSNKTALSEWFYLAGYCSSGSDRQDEGPSGT